MQYIYRTIRRPASIITLHTSQNMPRPSPFEPRQHRTSTSNKSNTVRTREYEYSQNGLQSAFLKADKAARVGRSRARKRLHNEDGWLSLSTDEQAVAIKAAEALINMERDAKKRKFVAEWTERKHTADRIEDSDDVKEDEFVSAMEDLEEDDETHLVTMKGKAREMADDIKKSIKGGRLMEVLNHLEMAGSYDESPCDSEMSSDDENEEEESGSEAEEDLEADEVDSDEE